MGWIEEVEATLAAVVDRVGESIVRVGHGAGMVVADGRVLTNAHNLRGAEPAVRFTDGSRATADVVGADVDGDLAVLAVETGGRAPVAWREDPVEVGTVVVAVAPSRRGVRATPGTVSATGEAFRGPRGRAIVDAVEHTAPLARGSSGGPVLDAEGRLVGVNTHRRAEGFYLALPATPELRQRIDALTRGEAPQRPRLGLAVAPPHVARRLRSAVGLEERTGLLVREVDPDGPAGHAGVRRGDLLVRAGDRDITDADDLFALLDGLGEGASLELGIVRGSEQLTVAVTFDGTREEGSA